MTALLEREAELYYQYSSVCRDLPGDTPESNYDRRKEHLLEMVGIQLQIRNFFRENPEYTVCQKNNAVCGPGGCTCINPPQG